MNQIKNVVDRFASFQIEAMSNLRSKDTGVDGAVIWISSGEFFGTESQHGPRIKVVLGDRITPEGLKSAVSVRITNPPEVLGVLPSRIQRQVIQFVKKNREILLQHWKGDLDSKEAVNSIEPI